MRIKLYDKKSTFDTAKTLNTAKNAKDYFSDFAISAFADILRFSGVNGLFRGSLYIILFFIFITLNSNLFAQKQEEIQREKQAEIQEETKDPFLSIDDKVKLLQKPVDISKLPYPIILNGIIWTKNLQLAIINNETVEKNQWWRDFKVEDIQKEKVILKLGDNHFEIPLAAEESNEKK